MFSRPPQRCFCFLFSLLLLLVSMGGCLEDDSDSGDPEYQDTVRYGFEIEANQSTNYTVKLPVPWGWELLDHVPQSSGNISVSLVNETRVVEKWAGPENITIRYLLINGSGNWGETFAYTEAKLSGIHFPPQDWENCTMDVYLESEPENDSLSFKFWFNEAYSSVGPDPPRVGHGAEYRSRGTSSANGWTKTGIEISMS